MTFHASDPGSGQFLNEIMSRGSQNSSLGEGETAVTHSGTNAGAAMGLKAGANEPGARGGEGSGEGSGAKTGPKLTAFAFPFVFPGTAGFSAGGGVTGSASFTFFAGGTVFAVGSVTSGIRGVW